MPRAEERLRIKDVLSWAEAHHRRTGRWPKYDSGTVRGQPDLTWGAIHWALYYGHRGMRGGSSLPKLLQRHFGVRNRADLPRLTVAKILKWADAHHRRTGDWPRPDSGPIAGVPGETWAGVNVALQHGGRGLRVRGSSLAQVLMKHRGRRRSTGLPRLTIAQILKWGRAHRGRTGKWPDRFAGAVIGTQGQESWSAIEGALWHGSRGLPGGSSLARLWQKHEGVRNRGALPPLTVAQILQWADNHHARTGKWPTQRSGAVVDAPGEKWSAIYAYFVHGHRGLPRGTTLPQLLIQHRGVHSKGYAPKLTIGKILEWADRHHARTGRWPTERSGALREAPDETWSAVHYALYYGHRGLRGGTSLARLLEEQRGVRNLGRLPRLSHEKIIAWAGRHHERTGEWPDRFSGAIRESPGDTWNAVEIALYQGGRGLFGGTTLNAFLAKHCGKRDRLNPPRLSITRILKWADEHYEHTGVWPTRTTGSVLSSPQEKWEQVYRALVSGKRGLRPGFTLRKLLLAKRGVSVRRQSVPLTRDVLLDWITAQHELTGSVPTVDSGPVIDEAGETWRALDASLRTGSRGLRGGISLEAFIAAHYTEPYAGIGQGLSEAKVIEWAVAFRERTGKWPTPKSAYVFPAPPGTERRKNLDRPGERWATIDRALREGRRGLPGGSSLAKLRRDIKSVNVARA